MPWILIDRRGKKKLKVIMKVLDDNFKYEEDMQPKSLLYKNLWLEAEAELCSVNYKLAIIA